jgi:hypothetical protein
MRKLTAELAGRGINTDPRAVWVFVHAEGLSFKKTSRAAERDRPDVARSGNAGRRAKNMIDAAQLVFVGETWIKTNMAPLRGWGPRGQRLRAMVPQAIGSP